jgi:hypothetical protein
MFTSLAIPEQGLPHNSAVYAFLHILSSEAKNRGLI